MTVAPLSASPATDTEVRATAAAAWVRYGSAVRMGGTHDERQWAFRRALAAERRVQQIDLTRFLKRP